MTLLETFSFKNTKKNFFHFHLFFFHRVFSRILKKIRKHNSPKTIPRGAQLSKNRVQRCTTPRNPGCHLTQLPGISFSNYTTPQNSTCICTTPQKCSSSLHNSPKRKSSVTQLPSKSLRSYTTPPKSAKHNSPKTRLVLTQLPKYL